MMNLKELAQRIDMAADASEKSNDVIGERLGLTGESVRTWRKGTTVPRLHHLIDLAKVLNVSEDWLLVGFEKPAGKAAAVASKPPIADKHLSLINNYKKLPGEIRTPIRMMIESMAVVANPNYHTKYKSQEKAARKKVRRKTQSKRKKRV